MVMNDEYALIKNNGCEVVPRPSGVNIIRYMWIFRHKFKSGGSFERYKARLVGDDKTQQVGIHCGDTFSPVVKPATIHTVLTLAVSQSWSIQQLDVKNSFLHGDLNETVCMYQPLDFRDPSYPDHFCKLHKYLYGFKQAPRAWYHRFVDYDSTIGFTHSKSDHSLFIYRRGFDTVCLLLYVDDIILTASSESLRRCSTISHIYLTGYFLCRLATLSIHASSHDIPHDRPHVSTSSSKCQATVSRASAEAKYRGVANVVSEACRLHNLLLELHHPLQKATIVYCDNISTIYLSENPIQHQRTKHVELDIHFVLEKVESGHVRVLHVPSCY
ncbi:transmembrane signal receptor [Lithospermum erythrorhizon]|uniref:Transmembrane signal receptor n=1 Tax=Lithospermum erythrorhizon TaxID=34254 RepID=A0AAV3NNJ4_LITER